MTTPSQIRYLNTDLDIICDADPAALVVELESFGLYVHRDDDDGAFCLMCEGQNEAEAQQNIDLLLKAIATLSPSSRSFWDCHCTKRELNVGYDCGDQPWAYNQGISDAIVRRMAEAGVSFRITLYPHRSDKTKDDGDADS